jgi:outer membrane protein
MKKLIAIAVWCFVALGANAQQVYNYGVKEAVAHGIKNTPQVKNALLDIKIQEQTNREVTALAYPQINASLGATHYFNIPVQSLPNFIAPSTYQVLTQEGVKDGNGNPIQFPAGGFGNISAQFGVPWTAFGGVEFSQILFDGQVFVGLQARSKVLELSRKQVEVTEAQIKANIYKVYYQLIIGKKQLEAVDANIVRIEKLLFDVKQIFKNGFAEKLDVDKVQVLLNNLTTEKQKIEYALNSGKAGLKFLLHMPQKDVLNLTDSITDDVLKENILTDSVSYTNRKDVQALELAKQLTNFNIKRFKYQQYPSLVAFGTYQKNAQRTKFDFFNRGDWFTTSLVGFKLQMPVFDGFARKAKLSKAKIQLQQLDNNIELLKSSIDMEVEMATLKMKTAILTVDVQKQNIALAEKVYTVTKKKFEQGLGNNQEIYTAQAELKVAQTNYYAALYDAITAKIDYLNAIGKL